LGRCVRDGALLAFLYVLASMERLQFARTAQRIGIYTVAYTAAVLILRSVDDDIEDAFTRGTAVVIASRLASSTFG
jgi:hypothetical protein